MVDTINDRLQKGEFTPMKASCCKVGTICLGKYTQDDTWYRVKILEVRSSVKYLLDIKFSPRSRKWNTVYTRTLTQCFTGNVNTVINALSLVLYPLCCCFSVFGGRRVQSDILWPGRHRSPGLKQTQPDSSGVFWDSYACHWVWIGPCSAKRWITFS